MTDAKAIRARYGMAGEYHLLRVDEATLRVLAELGIVTPTLQMQAREMVSLIEQHTLGKAKSA